MTPPSHDRDNLSAPPPIFKLKRLFNLNSTIPSPIPTSHKQALLDPNWSTAMNEEYRACTSNSTWVLIPHLANANVVCYTLLFRHKVCSDGSLERYKAHLVANGK